MAEGLAVAASVIAVLQITNSVISICYDYSAAATGASWELPRLTSELEGLRSVLQRLEPLAKRVDFSQGVLDAKLPAFVELCKPNGPLSLCSREIEKLEATLKTPDWSAGFGLKRKALVQALRWPLKSKDTEKALKQISRHRDALSFALTADLTALSLETHDAVLDSHQTVRSVEGVTSHIKEQVNSSKDVTLDVYGQVKSMKSSDRKKEILEWLSAPDPSTNYQSACESRHAATGSWLTESEEFFQWKMDANSLLWLHGKAGCGKTILSSTVITEIAQHCNHSSGSSLAYFFFDFNDIKKQQSSLMIRSIFVQLCSRSHEAMIELESLFASRQDGQQPADLATLKTILQKTIRKSKHIYIILDALDECSDIGDLLAVIQKIVEWNIPGLHLLCTSRWLTTVQETVQHLTIPERMIQIQNKAVEADVSSYIAHRVQTDPKLKRWRHRPDVQEEIRAALTEKANGMFRWAVCQLIALQGCPNLPSLRKALRSLPKTMDDTYSRILSNIPDEYSDYAVSVLRWLVYAERPMRLVELGEVILVDPSGDPWFDSDQRFPDPRDLLDILPGLLQVEQAKPASPIIRLAHFSVKEYLISERIKTQSARYFWLPEIQSHEAIAATCLAYILYFDSKDQSFIEKFICAGWRKNMSTEKYHLADYVCSYWTTHVKIADSYQGILKDLSLEFLRRSDLRNAWFRNYRLGSLLDAREEEPEYIPPLFIAAATGLLGIVQILLELGHDANERSTLGTAIETAATQGHDNALSVLLENGADPNLLGRDDRPPLQAAARFGSLESVKILIDFGAEIDDGRGSFGSPLIAACVSDRYGAPREKLAEFLLEKDVDIHRSSKKYGNALHAACAQSRADIALIKKLVSRGVEIDARGGKYGTALQAACAHSQNDQVIHFLLSQQADPCIEVEESKYGTALQAICAESHDNAKVVKLLLDHGSKKNARGGKYGNVLHAACYQRNERIVRLLLTDHCHGNGTAAEELDIDEVTAPYGTPLHAACFRGSEELIRLLVNRGADINASHVVRGTPFHAACLGGNEKAIRFLLDLGVDINVNLPKIGTPLHYIIGCYVSADTVRFLLARGADVNIKRNIQPYTALEILLQNVYLLEGEKIHRLRMLYEYGVVDTTLSQRDAKRLEKLKKRIEMQTDEGKIESERKTAFETDSLELSEP